jgi:hypothetical protein
MSTFVTPGVAQEIAEIIRRHHLAFGVVMFGADVLGDQAWKEAERLGLVPPGLHPKDFKSIAEVLHTFGSFLAAADDADAKGITLDEFRDRMEEDPIPRTEIEEHAGEFIRAHGAQHVTGLGGRAAAKATAALIAEDKRLNQEFRSTIRDVIGARMGDEDAAERVKERGIDEDLPDDFFEEGFRSTIKRQVSDIGHLTGEWERDLQRIVHTESHNAINEGRQEAWTAQEEEAAEAEERPVERVKVYKLPRPGACKHCIRLHLDGEHPRIYYLDEVQGNGTNVGRKADQWMMVVGSVHPWCGCSIHRVPAFVTMPDDWRSGEAAPKVIGPMGRLVMP